MNPRTPCFLVLILTQILMALPIQADVFSDRVSPRFFQPGVAGDVNAMVLHDGQVFAAGTLRWARGQPLTGIAAWDLATKTWDDLDGGLEGRIIALTSWNDGVVALMAPITYPEPQPQVVQYWNGESWQELGEGIAGSAITLADYNGQLYAGAYRWNGSEWEVVIPANGGIRTLLAWQGMLVVGGNFTEVDGVFAPGIATWDGQQFQPLGDGLDGIVTSLVNLEGDLVASGSISSFEPGVGYGVMRWDGSQWQGTGYSLGYFGNSIRALGTFQGRLLVGCFATNFGGNIHYGQMQNAQGDWELIEGSIFQDLRSFCEIPGGLLIGGSFSGLRGVGSPNLMHWDTQFQTTDQFPGLGLDAVAESGCVIADELVVGGEFGAAGPVQARKMAVFDGESWVPRDRVAFFDDVAFFHPAETVHKVLGGGWTLACHMERYGGYYFAPANGYWNYQENFWEGEESNVWLVAARDGYYVGLGPGGIWTRYLDQGEWEFWVPVTGGSARCMEYVDGDYVLGGDFTHVDGVACNRIARWSSDEGWTPMGFGLPGEVTCLGFLDDHVVAVYETESGDFQVCIFQGGWWLNLGPPFGGEVLDLVQYGDHLYAGGEFEDVGGEMARSLAWWDGDQWHSYGAGVEGGGYNTRVNEMVIYQDKLFLLGSFRRVAGVSSDNIACLESPLPGKPLPRSAPVSQDSRLTCTNHPNPFNPSTDILFNVPARGRVRLELFDLRGHLIKVLADENLEAGSYRRRWDGTDAGGRAMASGLYAVRLQGPGGELVTKITLVR